MYRKGFSRGGTRGYGSSSRGGKPGGSRRPPPHLKGKEIGLWYASQQKSRREAGEVPEIRPIAKIQLSEKKKQTIYDAISKTSFLNGATSKSLNYDHLLESQFKHEYLRHRKGNIFDKLKEGHIPESTSEHSQVNAELKEELLNKLVSKSYNAMQQLRQKLPSIEMKSQILDLIRSNQVVVISGETGCGKTTQVAQFILDDQIERNRGWECKIICTQPRRISAISVAERVAAERDEKLGISVGYQIRLEKVMPRSRGSILFCTTGVLLRLLSDVSYVDNVSHLILDEIHERDVTSDFLIAVLKDIVKYRPHLKVILMSATLNSEAFSKYYENAPHLNIPGFTYPVKQYYLEDVVQLLNYKFPVDRRPIWMRKKDSRKENEWHEYIEPHLRQLEADGQYSKQVIAELYRPNSEDLNVELIAELLKYICTKKTDDDGGAILVFLPGIMEIRALKDLLVDEFKFDNSRYIIIPLHSKLPTVDQRQIFQPAPKGKRKIIIATVIAETSITIDDVTTVIDCGYTKIQNLDTETGIETLKNEWECQANALQRKGRAGRVKPGVCYHLITKIRYNLFEQYLKPEVLRRRLEDVVLNLKMLQLGEAESFLKKLMDPPEAKSVTAAVELLNRLGALDEEQSLTPLGYHMAKLPLPPQCSKMLILAALFSCVDPILNSFVGYKDASELSMDRTDADKKRLELSRDTNSDHLCMHYAIRGFESAQDRNGYCRHYHLNWITLKLLLDMRREIAGHLYEMKFITNSNPRSSENNVNSDNVGLLKAIIAAGLYPNVGIMNTRGKFPRPKSMTNESMEFHKKSILSMVRSLKTPLVVYHIRLKSFKLYIHDATAVYPLSMIFFGDQLRIHNEERFTGVSVNSRLRFSCSASTGQALLDLRECLDSVLEYKLSHPGTITWNENENSPEINLLRTIMELIVTDHNEDWELSDYSDE